MTLDLLDHAYSFMPRVSFYASSSTKKKDMYVKLGKYMEAGVREYWLVDPKGKKVIVYDFEAEVTPSIYGFSSKVPVGIFKGECEVDFAKIYEYISFLYEEDDA